MANAFLMVKLLVMMKMMMMMMRTHLAPPPHLCFKARCSMAHVGGQQLSSDFMRASDSILPRHSIGASKHGAPWRTSAEVLQPHGAMARAHAALVILAVLQSTLSLRGQ